MNLSEILWFDTMAYAKPLFSPQEINASAKRFITFGGSIEELRQDLDVIDNWRASHAYPLNAFCMTLKNRAYKVHGRALVVQRIKRLESIAYKLAQNKKMKLTQMQDIGGCRAILPSIKDVYALRAKYMESQLVHTLNGEKDYIEFPKATGYRGIHLKYSFSSKTNATPYDQLKVEIQLRTQLQHIWATAVEAAATFTKQALKSNSGRQEWLRFFALMGSVFALKEGCKPAPGTPNNEEELREEIRRLDSEFHIARAFSGYRAILPHVQKRSNARYFLVRLDPVQLEVSVRGFKKEESQEANREYTKLENSLKGSATQVVLVSVSTVDALKRAYPNYFLDTEAFLREVTEIVSTVK